MKKRQARGFTLLEVTVAVALSTIVVGMVAVTLAKVIRDGKRARAHSEMMRDADFLGTMMNNELRVAGLGVPSKNRVGSPTVKFRSTVLLADNSSASLQQIGIVADLSKHYVQYPTFGYLHQRPTGNNAITWHTENNGPCAPHTIAGGSCSTATTSLFFPGQAGCASTAAAADKQCPWGMRRAERTDVIVIAAGDQTWTVRQLNGGAAAPPSAPGAPVAVANSVLGFGVIAAQLTAALPATWANNALDTAPTGIMGQGYVSHLDRVFYAYNQAAKTVVRTQCWASATAGIDPAATNVEWPPETTQNIASLTTSAAGVDANSTCIGPEVIARNVQSVAFTFFDSTGTAIAAPIITAAAKASIQRVDYRILFRQVIDGRNTDQNVAGSVRIPPYTELP